MIPTYNAGDDLYELVSSIGKNQLAPSSYRILIVDNNSDDSSLDFLTDRNFGDIEIIVHRNKSNIGRVENWNNAFSLAKTLNCQYGIFMFTNDRLINNLVLARLIEKIQNRSFSLILSPYYINNRENSLKIARKMSNSELTLNSKDFVHLFLSFGRFPFGPLQANIFNLNNNDLVFSSDLPLTTDQKTVIKYMCEATSNVLIASEPYLEWINSPNRTHNKIPYEKIASEELDLFYEMVSIYNIKYNADLVKTYMYLRHIKHAFENGDRSINQVIRTHKLIIKMNGSLRLKYLILSVFKYKDKNIL